MHNKNTCHAMWRRRCKGGECIIRTHDVDVENGAAVENPTMNKGSFDLREEHKECGEFAAFASLQDSSVIG